MSPTDHVTAVVVAWNGGDALDRCIASLLANGVRDIVVVDNGSAPGEQVRVRARYQSLTGMDVVSLATNCGFAQGANVGLRAALARDAAMALLVTQDVVLEPGAVDVLRQALADTDGAGIVGPLVLDSASSGQELSRGERVVLPFICIPRSMIRYRRRRTDPYDVSGLMGCVLLLSRACVESTGGFDPEYFAYYEEVDLCLRARRLRFRLLCAPQARAHHDGLRGFLAGFSALSAELKARNLIRLMRQLGGGIDWMMFVPTYLALVFGSALLYTLRGRLDVVGALMRGAVGGVLGRTGALSGPARSPA